MHLDNRFELYVIELWIDIPPSCAGGGDCWVMFVQPMNPYIRLFYIWVFSKPKYGHIYINSIRTLLHERKTFD